MNKKPKKEILKKSLFALQNLYRKIPDTTGCMENLGTCKGWCCRVQNPQVLYVEFLNTWESMMTNWSLEDILATVEDAVLNYISTETTKGCIFFDKEKCIAIGGLNIDPFIEGNEGTIGRVRHLYVSNKYRRQGLSKVLMSLILTEAKKNFKILRLSTNNPVAAHLYETLGFIKVEGHKVTHVLNNLKTANSIYNIK